MFQAGLNCVDTVLEASQYYGQNTPVSYFIQNGTTYSVSFFQAYPTFHQFYMQDVITTHAQWLYVPFNAQTCEQASTSPFTLTNAQGSSIAVAILLVWALGWSFKQLGKAINGGSPE